MQHLDIKGEYDSVADQVHSLQQQIAAHAVAGSAATKASGQQLQMQLGRLQRQQQELKSMLHVSETAVREARSTMQVTLECLLDAEALLKRAVQLKKQQDKLAPLFTLIARQAGAAETDGVLPTTCRLNLMVVSAVILMKGTFEQKYSFLLKLFYSPNIHSSVSSAEFDLEFLCNIFSMVQESLYLLQYVPFAVSWQEMTNMLVRGFISLKLQPQSDKLTGFEARQLMSGMIAHSQLLNDLLGINHSQEGSGRQSGAGGGSMSTFQRNHMSPAALFRRGLIDFDVLQFRQQVEAARYKPALNPQRKQQLHSLALAMGLEDPLRANYTKFLVKPKAKDKTRVDSLEHGHLGNLHYAGVLKDTQAAIRLQSIFRSFQDRKVAELAARHAAYLEAKTTALKEMKTKVLKEFRKREAGKGMGKMKWDAQVPRYKCRRIFFI